jgi:formate dehydrogenase subunit delta
MQSSSERLVRMANQIASAFATRPEDKAVAEIAHHIEAFWDPRMRRAIAEHAAAGGQGLTPRAKSAVLSLNS